MIVELLDYRPQKFKEPALETPERTRVVLHPNSETLWADICLLNQKTGNQWTDQDALEIEARLLVRIFPDMYGFLLTPQVDVDSPAAVLRSRSSFDAHREQRLKSFYSHRARIPEAQSIFIK